MDLYLSRFPDARIRIVVPTIPLAQQWQLALLHHVKDPALRPGFWGGGIHSPAGSRVMIYIVNSISRGICHLLGVDPDQTVSMTEMELRTIMDVSQEDEIVYVRFDTFGERRIAPDMLDLSTE